MATVLSDDDRDYHRYSEDGSDSGSDSQDEADAYGDEDDVVAEYGKGGKASAASAAKRAARDKKRKQRGPAGAEDAHQRDLKIRRAKYARDPTPADITPGAARDTGLAVAAAAMASAGSGSNNKTSFTERVRLAPASLRAGLDKPEIRGTTCTYAPQAPICSSCCRP